MKENVLRRSIFTSVSGARKASYDDLVEAYWDIWYELDVETFSWKHSWHNRIFVDTLKCCGWSLSEWNDVNEEVKATFN